MTHISPNNGGMRLVRNAMSVPMLTREREMDLARAWRDKEDEAALHELINAYGRLVAGMAVKFRNYGLPVADLIQEGNVGLMQAASRFEPERELRFSTYASWWVRSAMQDYILRNWSIVRTGTTSSQKSLFFNLRRLRAKIEGKTGGVLDDAGRQAIASELKVPKRDVDGMSVRLAASDQSLNAPVGEEGDLSWQDYLVDERPNPEANAIATKDGETRSDWVKTALSELPSREERIIRARLLQDDTLTLEALGAELGVSKERVRQLEKRALGKLKEQFQASFKNPDDFLN
ncbi:MAG: RNA polymerase factor sigma-32 [Alphaproteobacteria bacterium]|jgi:RNA polymerase sigma-32 factor|nr:RNA polymerase factor sigma-32 [Alphaproteobacteria bacterium]